MPAEPWRVGRHVPHHIYRGDGNQVADEVAVTHDPAVAAQIVAEHALVDRYRTALEHIRYLLENKRVRRTTFEIECERIARVALVGDANG